MFHRFIVIVALIWSSLAVARPPASDVQGLYQNTRPDRKEYSPLWGMVALEGELLKGSRFYSDYGILSRDPDKAKTQLHLMAPAVKSAMDRQIKKQQDILAQHPNHSKEQVVDHLEQQLKVLKDEKKHI